ncbi:MAG TPA: periplasmic heavy metal sensor [Crenalkalicoccus sp.]|jgi:uncharacterized membrane protein|nr:periplasmic heavy metal sensor [Crenalkalicoccus sp.]
MRLSATLPLGDLPRGLSRGTLLGALLGASVVLNLVLAGLLLWPAAPPRHSFERVLGRMEQALPAEDRPRFRAVLDAERDRYSAQLAAAREARREVDAVLVREPFDPAELHAAVERWSERWRAFNLVFADTMVRAMAAVSAQGRAQLAARDTDH